jgi:hypothetical protein
MFSVAAAIFAASSACGGVSPVPVSVGGAVSAFLVGNEIYRLVNRK